MALFILLLLILLPVAELAVLIDVGKVVGSLGAVGLCLLTAAVGLSLVKMQGTRVLAEMREQANRGEPVGAKLVHAFFLVLAGIALLIPGFITDAVGALLLLPPLRLMLGRAWLKRMRARMAEAEKGGPDVEGTARWSDGEATIIIEDRDDPWQNR
ncbi:FxsA family protein [Yunchengibacter salinarum]|uniref:FxsA family protein n=1 Tax=Yunchengibacter salinarum TaxID=3133399 RepID=UPI0035B5ABD8